MLGFLDVTGSLARMRQDGTDRAAEGRLLPFILPILR